METEPVPKGKLQGVRKPWPHGMGVYRCPVCFSPLLQELSRQQKEVNQPKEEVVQPGFPQGWRPHPSVNPPLTPLSLV
jgi:hypothetical protein